MNNIDIFSFDSEKKEEFENYYRKVKKIYPNWPKEVIKQWPYRHKDCLYNYMSLDFSKFKFDLEVWGNESVYSNIGTYKIDMVDSLGTQILQSNRSFLQKYMLNEKTWPSPIIVFKSNKENVDSFNRKLNIPYHLLEGHLRLGYFRNLYRHKQEGLLGKHYVYVVTIDE